MKLSTSQQKVLDIYHNDGHVKAWNYWKLMGNTYGIFLGEVPSNKFIDSESLANHIGLTEGKLRNIHTRWLKFILDGNIIYVAKKPLMHSVSWNVINQYGAVFEHEGATIGIGGNTYDITLLRGLNSNINFDCDYGHGFDIHEAHQSEWNRLMYPIHSGVHTDNDNPSNPSVLYTQWANYSDSDLGCRYNLHGAASWVQETQNIYDTISYIRGYIGLTYVNGFASISAASNGGWRPALRLINND